MGLKYQGALQLRFDIEPKYFSNIKYFSFSIPLLYYLKVYSSILRQFIQYSIKMVANTSC